MKLPGPDFKQIFAIEPEQLQRFVGRFVAPSKFALELSRKEHKLYAQVDGPGQGLFRIVPVSETHFEYVGLKAAIEFEMDEAGAVAGLVFKQNGIEYRCKSE